MRGSGKSARRDGGLVYSTAHGQMCPRCGQPTIRCACRRSAAPPKGDGVVRVMRQTKGRRGKGVTLITGVPLAASELASLCKALKRKCGSGGTVKDGTIEIQGDHRDSLVVELERRGWVVKRAGGCEAADGRGARVKGISLLLAAVTVASCAPAPVTTDTTVFRHVNVIDVADGLRPNMVVRVAAGRIIEVAAETDETSVDGARVVDGEGRYLIPGLWDAHVHLTFTPELEAAMFPLFLANGVTSVRDTGGLLEKVLPWRQRVREAAGAAPRVFVAGPLVDGVPRVYDGGTPSRPELAIGVGTVEEGERAVDELVAVGVDLVKAYEMLDPDVYRAIVAWASLHGLPVTGHVPLSMDAGDAAIAGLRSLEHLRNLELACSSEAEAMLSARREMLAAGVEASGGALRGSIHAAQRTRAVATYDADRCAWVIERLGPSDTRQVPTLTIVTPRVTRLFARPSWRQTFRYLPEPVRTAWIRNATAMADEQPDAAALAHAQWAFRMVARLQAAGIGIMAGTDTPIFFLTPGFSLHEELVLLVEAGLTPLQALQAATQRPAQYFGLEDELGAVAVGMHADLVLLEANPLDDIRNTQRIVSVMVAGRLYDRTALDGLLAQLESSPEQGQ